MSYTDICGVLDLERKTANQYLLNPYSGEWIKGLRIVIAEMGLIDFNDKKPRTLLSTSFNPEVGKAFSNINRNEQITFSYIIKFTYSIKNLFMTFFETKAFNERYQEQEAVILYRDKFTF